MHTGTEHVGNLPFVEKCRDLTLSDSQHSAILDFAVGHRHAPREVAGLLGPIDNVNELLRKKIENAHVVLQRMLSRQ